MTDVKQAIQNYQGFKNCHQGRDYTTRFFFLKIQPYATPKTYFRFKTSRLKIKEWKKISHAKNKLKKGSGVTPISNKID